MRRRTERRLTAARAAAASLAVGALLLGSAAGASAADSPAPPTPTPAPLLSPLTPGATSSSGSTGSSGSPSPIGPGFGSVAGDLVLPVFDEIRVAATLSMENVGPVPAAALEPGGGTSSNPTPWKPKAVIKIPVAAPPRKTTGGAKATLSKDEIIWAAYVSAAKRQSSCHIPVMLLAAIGEVESSSLRGRSLDASHDVVPPVLGPALTGGAYSSIRDTDGGRYDGDPVWDRAVGPMQFIPGTWRLWGADGNGDGVADPQNIEDAALAAADYLCAGGRDLSRQADLEAAVLSYNHSQRYLATVLGIVQAVDSGQLAGP
ncbi:lytic murein transglycosylase [Terrabacter sp. C0L_2]|uniref:lytic murein transglycosylase n=1 Tax=Terrabacter sp. C0L_2 TaxID=3108389 RepID=UPI002ED6B9DB|nr:lytic murein transglycosylase [Terrabacter sp. C0L_2]